MELDGCLINQGNEPQPADMTNIDLQLDPGSAGSQHISNRSGQSGQSTQNTHSKLFRNKILLNNRYRGGKVL